MRYLIILFLLNGCISLLSVEEKKAMSISESKSKDTVVNFIKKYAQFPETYKPISFGYFSKQLADTSGGSNERFTLLHKFSIRNLSGEVIIMKVYFFLNKNFVVCAVYNELHPKGRYAYSSLELWTTTVGRPFTQIELQEIGVESKLFDM